MMLLKSIEILTIKGIAKRNTRQLPIMVVSIGFSVVCRLKKIIIEAIAIPLKIAKILPVVLPYSKSPIKNKHMPIMIIRIIIQSSFVTAFFRNHLENKAIQMVDVN